MKILAVAMMVGGLLAQAEVPSVECVGRKSQYLDFAESELQISRDKDGFYSARGRLENCTYSIQSINGKTYSASVLDKETSSGSTSHSGFDSNGSLILNYSTQDSTCMLVCRKNQ